MATLIGDIMATQHVSAGAGGGYRREVGLYAYATTATTITIPLQNMQFVKAVYVQYVTAPAIGDLTYWGQDTAGVGYKSTDGTITLTRAAGTTPAMKIRVTVEGY